jgi:hypothetical protein
VEDVPTRQLFTFGDRAQADATLEILALLALHIIQLFEFKYELSPLVHVDETSANSCQIIDHLTQQVQRQWASRNNKQENADIKC